MADNYRRNANRGSTHKGSANSKPRQNSRKEDYTSEDCFANLEQTLSEDSQDISMATLNTNILNRTRAMIQLKNDTFDSQSTQDSKLDRMEA